MVFKKGYTPWNKRMNKEELIKHYKKGILGNGGFKEGNKLAKGNHPKTEFKEGYHPQTEFKKGCKPWSYIDGQFKKRKRNKKEAYRNWYESNNLYRVPKYCLIHHIDKNPLNNNITNLQLMTKDFHNRLHNEHLKQIRMEVIV